jgi:2,4-dienoyl-CoA reductase-like NADH-dependent reductase (Old Yellow Enzyme family)
MRSDILTGSGLSGRFWDWTEDHINGWRKVTQSVKAAGGRIFMQIWHAGRISDPILHDGMLPVAPSAIAAKGNVSHLRPERAFVTPRSFKPACTAWDAAPDPKRPDLTK